MLISQKPNSLVISTRPRRALQSTYWWDKWLIKDWDGISIWTWVSESQSRSHSVGTLHCWEGETLTRAAWQMLLGTCHVLGAVQGTVAGEMSKALSRPLGAYAVWQIESRESMPGAWKGTISGRMLQKSFMSRDRPEWLHDLSRWGVCGDRGSRQAGWPASGTLHPGDILSSPLFIEFINSSLKGQSPSEFWFFNW